MSIQDLHEQGEYKGGYILVDLDRTLAHYAGWKLQKQQIGLPVPAMLERVQRWLHLGIDVRIFTARASSNDPEQIERIRNWCKYHIGAELPIQNWKDFNCIRIWDDLAVGVEANTGLRLCVDPEGDPLSDKEEDELIDHSEEMKDRMVFEDVTD